jgi:hypothetical protein
MKKVTQLRLLAISAGTGLSSFASAAGPDFSAITGAIDSSTIVTAIAAIAAIKILPGVARWGFNQVITWFK